MCKDVGRFEGTPRQAGPLELVIAKPEEAGRKGHQKKEVERKSYLTVSMITGSGTRPACGSPCRRGKNQPHFPLILLPSFSGALHWSAASRSCMTRDLARLASLYKQQSGKEWRRVLEEKKEKDISPKVIFLTLYTLAHLVFVWNSDFVDMFSSRHPHL